MATNDPTMRVGTRLIQGRVSVEGTGRGIRDLLVVAYDADPAASAQRTEHNQATRAASAAAMQSGAPRLDDDLSHVVEADARHWIDYPGDRLGSVLTDQDGKFALSFQDDEYRKANVERWPDLLLFVFAPSRALTGSSRDGVLLHAEQVVRANAARVESYSIIVNREKLDEAGVFVGGSLRTSVQELKKNDDAHRQSTTSLLKENVKRAAKTIASAPQRKQQVLRALRAQGIEEAFNLPLFESASKLQPQVHREAVDRLAAYEGKARFHIPFEVLQTLGTNVRDLEAGERVPVSMCDVLARRSMGPALSRVRTLLDEVRTRSAVAQTQRLDDDPDDDTSDDDSDGDDHPRAIASKPV